MRLGKYLAAALLGAALTANSDDFRFIGTPHIEGEEEGIKAKEPKQ